MTPQRRMDETLVELGGSVLNGGLSTLLGVLVMAFSKSAAFQTLFQMFLSMVVFGLAHGLVFLPCLIFLIALASSRFSKRKPSVEASSSTSRASPATEAGVLAEIGGGNEASL
jgi:Niemann-Pick C1 protein